MKNRLFSIVLSIILIMTMVPCVSFADEETAAPDTEAMVLDSAQPEEEQIEEPADEVQPEEEPVQAEEPEKVPLKLSTPKATAKGTSQTKVKISWKKIKNARGYQIYRYNKSKKKYVLIKTIKSGSTLSYVNTGLKHGTSYAYRVKAYAYDDGKKVYSSRSNKATGKTKARYKVIKVKAWAYTGGGHTATGKKVKKGIIAVDPKVIKLHSKVYIPGYGYARAEDTGGNIKGKKIDVYYPKASSCYRWGARYVKIKVYY